MQPSWKKIITFEAWTFNAGRTVHSMCDTLFQYVPRHVCLKTEMSDPVSNSALKVSFSSYLVYFRIKGRITYMRICMQKRHTWIRFCTVRYIAWNNLYFIHKNTFSFSCDICATSQCNPNNKKTKASYQFEISVGISAGPNWLIRESNANKMRYRYVLLFSLAPVTRK